MYIFIGFGIDFIYDVIVVVIDEWVQVSNDIDRVVNVIFVYFFVSSDVVNVFFQQVVVSVGQNVNGFEYGLVNDWFYNV